MSQPEDDVRCEEVDSFLPGGVLAPKVCCDEMDLRGGTLDPDSTLFFTNGLVTVTLAPASCQLSVCGLYPLMGMSREGLVKGYFGAELRFAGGDGLIITGGVERAPRGRYNIQAFSIAHNRHEFRRPVGTRGGTVSTSADVQPSGALTICPNQGRWV